MLKKEVNETLKQTLYLLALVIVIPLIVLAISKLFSSSLSYIQLFFFIFQVGLVVFSMFMGISLFSKEMKDRGMEYLLTLPYSRYQLLGFKLVPRALSVAAVFGIYVLILLVSGINPETSKEVFVLPTGVLVFMGFSFFIIGISFSITRKGIIISALATFFSFLFFLFIIYLILPAAIFINGYHGYYSNKLEDIFTASPNSIFYFEGILLIGTFAAFLYAFKHFNLGSIRAFIKRYLKVFIPILIIVNIIAIAWASTNLWTPKDHFYLTDSHQLIESNFFDTKVYNSGSTTKIDIGEIFWWNFSLEKDNYFYTITYGTNGYKLVRFDLQGTEDEAETIYEAKTNTALRELYTYQDSFATIMKKNRNSERLFYLLLLKLGKGITNKIQIPYQGRNAIFYPKLFGTDEIAGKRFWLVRFGYDKMNKLYRAWEDGKIEYLSSTDRPPVYTRGMLFTKVGNSIHINRFSSQGLELEKKLSVDKGFALYAPLSSNLDQRPFKELYGADKGEDPYWRKKVYRLDLNTLEIDEVQELRNTTGLIAYAHPDNWYYVELDPQCKWTQFTLKKMYRLHEGRVELLKEFEPIKIQLRRDYFAIFNTGMVVSSNGNTKVYSLPDMKEIQFKGLY